MEAVKTEICLSEASLFPFSLQQTALAQPGAVLIFASFHQGKEGLPFTRAEVKKKGLPFTREEAPLFKVK
ncbi:MAG: hypothetical protein BGO34_03610 [Bacteroidia bacterium 44-10]|nr:MAG: hypothetical protein BGO34_03610 [Bacteroidia bacterium 44-10]